MEQFIELVLFNLLAILLVFLYFNHRLNHQDKYLSTYLQAFSKYSHTDDFKISPPNLNTTEILNKKKPEVYSPRHDQETVMQGKVIDPFD